MGRSSDSRSSGPILRLKDTSTQPESSPINRLSPPPLDSFSPSSDSSSKSVSLFNRSSSPTRVNLRHSSPPPVRILLDRSLSPPQSVSIRDQAVQRRKQIAKITKKTCMCSPTTHPGSFRCNYHKNLANQVQNQSFSFSPSRLNLRRSAMTNSLVRIGTVEGDWMKRALSALIRPSSHQQRRRVDFQPKPSRLSIMSKAEDSEEVDSNQIPHIHRGKVLQIDFAVDQFCTARIVE